METQLTRATSASLRAKILEAATGLCAAQGFIVEAGPIRYDHETGIFRLRLDGFTAEARAARTAALARFGKMHGFDPSEPGRDGEVLVDYDPKRRHPWVYDHNGHRRAATAVAAAEIWPVFKPTQEGDDNG